MAGLEPNKTYRVQSVSDKTFLGIEGVKTKICTNSEKNGSAAKSQMWIVRSEGGGIFRFEPVENGNVVMTMDPTTQLLKIERFNADEQTLQTFFVEDRRDGTFFIYCAFNNFLIRNMGINKQAKCEESDNPPASQVWKILPV